MTSEVEEVGTMEMALNRGGMTMKIEGEEV
jgi:hypothetical protein